MKKILIPLLSLSVAITPFAASCTHARQEQNDIIDKKYLKIDDGVLKGFKDEYKTKDKIPSSLNTLFIDKEITSIEAGAFVCPADDKTASENIITKIDMSESSISSVSFGINTFIGLKNLKTIVFPESIFLDKSITSTTFSQCTSLCEIDLTNVEVTAFGPGATFSWFSTEGWPSSGKILCNAMHPGSLQLGKQIKEDLNLGANWLMISK